MQASDRVLARRYGLALYQSALENKEERKIGEELAKIGRKLSDKMSAYNHPRISPEDKKSLLSREVGSSVSKRTMKFFELLIDKKRFGLLPQIALVYGGFCDEGEGVVHAKVRSAHELGEKEQAGLAKRLGERFGKKIVLNLKIDESLLAGVIVRIGDWVFDASLKGELERMRGKLSTRN